MQERKSLLFVSFQNVRSPTASTRRRERRRGPSRPWRSCCRTFCPCIRVGRIKKTLPGLDPSATDNLEGKHAGGESADPTHCR